MATPPLIPVGLDLGSIHARVCVHNAVVSNTQGHRLTPTFCANETPDTFIFGDAARVFCTKNQLDCVSVQESMTQATAHAFLGHLSTLASDSAAVGADHGRRGRSDFGDAGWRISLNLKIPLIHLVRGETFISTDDDAARTQEYRVPYWVKEDFWAGAF